MRKLNAASHFALRRLLTSIDEYGKDSTLAGRLNPQRFARAYAGAELVCIKRTHTPAVRTALTVLVDLSGSMNGPNIINVGQFIEALAPAFERAHVAWQILGFNDGNAGATQVYGDQSITNKSALAYAMGARVYRFKRFGTRWSKVAKGMAHALDMHVGGGTPDYPAVYQCALELAQRPEERRILMVLTDGIGDGGSVKPTCAWAAAHGVEVLGIGIGRNIQVQGVYPFHAAATNAADMLTVGLPALANVVLRARTRKGAA